MTDWRDSAACAGMDPGLFFPAVRENIAPEVRALCASCPVRVECLNEGLANPPSIDHGVWGGTSVKERRAIRRHRRPGRAPNQRRAAAMARRGTPVPAIALVLGTTSRSVRRYLADERRGHAAHEVAPGPKGSMDRSAVPAPATVDPVAPGVTFPAAGPGRATPRRDAQRHPAAPPTRDEDRAVSTTLVETRAVSPAQRAV